MFRRHLAEFSQQPDGLIPHSKRICHLRVHIQHIDIIRMLHVCSQVTPAKRKAMCSKAKSVLTQQAFP
ncbi:hypothetical protein D3C84_1259570 [compost metagenome]